jgi:hypothetical protein
MTIQLFPCGHTPCACPVCEHLLDILHPAPSRTLVYQPNPGATSLSGTITYDSGSATMIEVPAGSTLCVGGLSYDGPLLYTSAVPYAATLVSAAITYTPSSGPPPISFDVDVVTTCTNPITEIEREIVLAICDIAASVVDTGDACPPCCAQATRWYYSSGWWSALGYGYAGDVYRTEAGTNNCGTLNTCGICCTTAPTFTVTRAPSTVASLNFEPALNGLGYSAAQKLAFYNASFSETVSMSLSLTTATVNQVSIWRTDIPVAKAAGTYVVTFPTHPVRIQSTSGNLCGTSGFTEATAQWSPSFRMPDGCGKIVLAMKTRANITSNWSGNICYKSYNYTGQAAVGFMK